MTFFVPISETKKKNISEDFCRHFVFRISSKSDENCRTEDNTYFTPLHKEWLSLNRFWRILHSITWNSNFLNQILSVFFFSPVALGPFSDLGLPFRGYVITLRHTTLVRTPLDEWSHRSSDLYLTTYNTYTKHASRSLTEFEPLRNRATNLLVIWHCAVTSGQVVT